MDRYHFDPAVKAVLERLRVPLAVYQFVEKRVVTVVLSDGFCKLFDYEDKRQAYYDMDHNMYKMTHPDDVSRIANEAFRFATEGGSYEVVYRTLTANHKNYKIIHSFGEHVFAEDGTRLAYVWYTDEGSYTDEADNQQSAVNAAFCKALQQESFIKASYYDFLTGLPCMSYFFELADDWRTNHASKETPVALLYMDLCGMKFFNRKFGFSEGDQLLRGFGNILKKHFSNENCSRFGSDHFCVFTEAKGVEDKLRQIFSEFSSFNKKKNIPVRVGIFIDTGSALSSSACCDRAKYACDTMRHTFLSRYCYFNDSMLEQADLTQYFIDNLDRAIEERWIQVYYQPIIRAANGRVCDEEALARWVDPVRGVISPSEFIPILEEARLIYKLDLYIVEQVLEKITRQRDAGLYMVAGSVNLSRVDFDTCDIVEEVCRRVDASGLGRNCLKIELTESSVGRDYEYMKAQIDRFRELGFHVWMDDFGSGYSSLDLLQSIRFDLIKFDMRFMKEFYNGEKSRIILTELIKLAIALGIDTVCEGVETREQADFLREVGCTKLQGYFFCKPIPEAAIFDRYRRGIQIGFENPLVSAYYADIGRINLYDLASVSGEETHGGRKYFNTVPMAIFETDENSFQLVRCNRTFRKFIEKTFGAIPIGESLDYSVSKSKFGSNFLKSMRDTTEIGSKLFFSDEMSDGTSIKALLKLVSSNPVGSTRAFVVAVLSVDYGIGAASMR
ncbi:MAG: GGDEF domain-containing protein [Ruminococcus sp.]|nr:GGDEF domain-containing protein [Ruminococcus sp.]